MESKSVFYTGTNFFLISKQRPDTGNQERNVRAKKQEGVPGTDTDEVPVTQTSPNNVSHFLM
jgi:hypothetical protein